MSPSADFITVDLDSGETCVMFILDGVGHEVTAEDMAFDLRKRGIEALSRAEPIAHADDQDIEQFVKSFEHAYPTQRD